MCRSRTNEKGGAGSSHNCFGEPRESAVAIYVVGVSDSNGGTGGGDTVAARASAFDVGKLASYIVDEDGDAAAGRVITVNNRRTHKQSCRERKQCRGTASASREKFG